MVVPSIDTGSQSSWPKGRSTPTAGTSRSQLPPGTSTPPSEALESKQPAPTQEKQQPETEQKGLQLLDEDTFNGSSGSDTEDLLAARQDAQQQQPDYTLELSGTDEHLAAAAKMDFAVNKASSEKSGDERAQLPYTFKFGMPRPQALAVVMSKPQLGNQPLTNAQEAIQQTLDLAATNRLPYEKGSQVSLVA